PSGARCRTGSSYPDIDPDALALQLTRWSAAVRHERMPRTGGTSMNALRLRCGGLRLAMPGEHGAHSRMQSQLQSTVVDAEPGQRGERVHAEQQRRMVGQLPAPKHRVIAESDGRGLQRHIG